MYKYLLTAALLCGTLFLSCDRGNDGEDSPWPVWILRVTALDGTTRQPIQSCAEVVWGYSGSAANNRTTCADTDSDDPSFVKVWKPIREERVTIFYHVEASGYLPSVEQSQTFELALAYTRPGAPGDEVIESVQVLMFSN